MMRRFVVRSGDGRTLSELLDRAGSDRAAIVDGRVFVGPRRTTDPDHPLCEGDEIFVATESGFREETPLLGHDRGLFAFSKPAGLPTVPDQRGNASLLRSAARVLGVEPAELHVVTRLDTNVSGVVVVANGGIANRRAAQLQASGGLVRRYLGLSVKAPSPPAGHFREAVMPKRRPHGRRSGVDARPATTSYRLVEEAQKLPSGKPALVAFEPRTGRMHQIRLHAAGAGAPLLGDVAYGGPPRVVLGSGAVLDVPRIALHACQVKVASDKGAVVLGEAPHPPDLVALWDALGGTVASFETARSVRIEEPPRDA